MLRALGLGVILFSFWLALSGHYTPLLLSFGVASTVLVTFVALRMDAEDGDAVPIHLGLRFFLYLPWLMKEILLANITVAKIILSPQMRISPRMVRFHGSQRTDLGRALYANSITLTPGTITTGVEGEVYEIHALTAEDLDSNEQDEMNRRCTFCEGGS